MEGRDQVMANMIEAMEGLLSHLWDNRKKCDVRKDFSLMVHEAAARKALDKAKSELRHEDHAFITVYANRVEFKTSNGVSGTDPVLRGETPEEIRDRIIGRLRTTPGKATRSIEVRDERLTGLARMKDQIKRIKARGPAYWP